MKRFTLLLCTLLALGAAPAQATPRLDGSERALIGHINAARAQYGLGPLRKAWKLQRAADAHSRDMRRRGFFDHASSDGTPFQVRVRRFTGPVTVGETLAALPPRPGAAATVVQMWMDSPPHRAILLAPEFRRIGVARRGARWTADFAGGR